LGFESIELQRAEVKEVMRRRNVYKSAIMEALGKIACIRFHYIPLYSVSIIVSYNEENKCSKLVRSDGWSNLYA
jgi:hypothetical protein